MARYKYIDTNPRFLAVDLARQLLPGRGVLTPDQTVLIRGPRIAGVGLTGLSAVPSSVRVVDGRGKFLIPGLWDMHVHASRQGRPHYFWPL